MKMKLRKKTLAALLVVVMLFCALPMGAAAEGHENHDDVTFTEAYSGGAISGRKYLEGDVTETDITVGPSNTSFCLNGHTLTFDSLKVAGPQFFLYDCAGNGKIKGDISVEDGAGLFIHNGVSVGDVTVKNHGYIGGAEDEAEVGSVTAESGETTLAGKLSVGYVKIENGASLVLHNSLVLSGSTVLDMPLDGSFTMGAPSTVLEHLVAPAGYRFVVGAGSVVTLEPILTLTVQAAPAEGGSVSIEGQSGTTVTPSANDELKLIAAANTGYAVDGWYDAADAKLSAGAEYTYTFPGTENVTLTAKFVPVAIVEDVFTAVNAGGTVQFTATCGGAATTILGVTPITEGAPECSDEGVVDMTAAAAGFYEYEFACAEGGTAAAKLYINGITAEGTTEFELGSVAPDAAVAFGTPVFSYSKDGVTFADTAPDSAGTWTVKVTVTEDRSAHVPALECSYEITVKLPKPTVSAAPAELTLSGDSGAATLTVSAPAGVGFQWKKDGAEISGATSAELVENYTHEDTGTHTYTCVITAGGQSTESDAVTVLVKDVNTIGEVQIADWVYGGTPSVPTVEHKYGDPVFTYSAAADGTYNENVPENAGDYYVKASVPAGDGYEAVESQPKKFTVRKAEQAAPADLVVEAERVKTLKNGKISHVTSKMEYKLSTEPDTAWKTCPDGEITKLAPGAYEVRYKETENYKVGAVAKAIVAEGGGIPEDSSYRFTYVKLTDVPKELSGKFANFTQMQTEMLAQIKENEKSPLSAKKDKSLTAFALWNVELEFKLKDENEWHIVTGEIFPSQGFLITIPYSSIANGMTSSTKAQFYAAHIFTYGEKKGTYEFPEVTTGSGGVSLKISGTSPLMVAYHIDGSNNKDPQNNTGGGGSGTAVATGDTNNPLLWASLLGVGALGLGATVAVPKLKKRKQEKSI